FDGTVATFQDPDDLRLHDAVIGKSRRLPLKEKGGFFDLSFSPDGRLLLAMDRAAEVVLFWDVRQGRLLRRLAVPGLARIAETASLLLSGDGETLASRELWRAVRTWDARTGKPRMNFPGHVAVPHWLSYSPDGKVLTSFTLRGIIDGHELFRWDVA